MQERWTMDMDGGRLRICDIDPMALTEPSTYDYRYARPCRARAAFPPLIQYDEVHPRHACRYCPSELILHNQTGQHQIKRLSERFRSRHLI
jgi:hypothetical protein